MKIYRSLSPAGSIHWVTGYLLMLSSAVPALAQSQLGTPERVENRKGIHFYSDDIGDNQSHRTTYAVFGNDLQGTQELYVAFDLQQRQTIRYEIVDIAGKRIVFQDIPEVLDETYRIPVRDVSAGIYVLRLMFDQQCYAERILLK